MSYAGMGKAAASQVKKKNIKTKVKKAKRRKAGKDLISAMMEEDTSPKVLRPVRKHRRPSKPMYAYY